MAECIFDSCTKPSFARGWCRSHYNAWSRTGGPASYRGRPTAAERFRSIGWTVKESGCWEWNGSRVPQGYGQFKASPRMLKAHRFSFEHFIGPIPEGLLVRHNCDNPPCVNPDHLVLGTHSDNAWDRSNRGRNGWRKLDDPAVSRLRREIERGRPIREIAENFAVSKSLVLHIRDGLVRTRPTRTR